MNELNKAIVFAAQLHEGQTDKGGNEYIQHPLRVMDNVETRREKIVAVLHDVVEDTDATVENIEEQFGRSVAKDVAVLTKEDGQEYMEYIDQICSYPVPRRVKRADLHDNMDLSRLREITQKDLERRNRYERAFDQIEAACVVL